MIDQRDFVLSPDIAHSPEKLAQFLTAEMGVAYLAACSYRIEKRSIDARSRQIKVNLRIGFYEKGHDFSLSAQLPTLPKEAKKVIIIGSGPAGLTAAIYTARASLEPLVIEGEPSSTSDQPGGQLMLTTEIENFPGFPEGIMGPELMGNFRSQAQRFGAEMVTEKVSKVDFSSKPFKVWVRDTEYTAESVIVATGAQSLMLDLPREGELIGHGVSTCATCDGFFFRGHEIAVVGGGDSAIEEANFLTKFASKVYLVVRRDALRASRIMQQRALDNPKIEILWNSRVSELHGEGTLSGVTITDTVTNETRPLAVTGLFIAIGHKPNTGLFTNILDMEESGYLLTREGSTYTNVPGIFACGDVQDHTYRQAITAAGSGCMAAIDAERWLESQH